MGNNVVVGLLLRDRLGPEVTQGLTEYVERNGEVWRADVIQTCTERLDRRMERIDDGFARIVNQIADLKADLVKWSFKFWFGQVIVTLGIAALLVNLLR